MKLSQFKFKLPEEKIALHPAKYRDESRLMVVHKSTGQIEHKVFKDILEYFDDKDVFIFNDTKVFPARLYGNKEKTGARIEVFLLRELNEELRLWDVLVDPARKIRIGNKLYFGDDDSMVAEVIDNTTSRGRTLRFLYDGPHDEFKKALYALGEAPLPSFIRRPVEEEDAERFQTIFAKNEGAVTAPTAGLHFSRELMKRMEIKGIDFAYVTMHAGLGNFREIDVEDLTKHKMDSEQMFVDAKACNIVNQAKDENRRVCTVGINNMCCKRAFLRGAFLAGGSISDPEKSYHFEIVSYGEAKAVQIMDAMKMFELDARIIERRRCHVVYLKEGAQIVDILNVMGAHRSLMELENVRVVKEVRNSVNRKVN